jgi:hypothetical protein
MRDQDSDQVVAHRFDLTMRELLEKQESAPDEPRSTPSRERLLHAIDAEIEKLSDILDHEEELRNRRKSSGTEPRSPLTSRAMNSKRTSAMQRSSSRAKLLQ